MRKRTTARQSRKEIMAARGCTIDFTIRRAGASRRIWMPEGEPASMTWDVECSIPRVEVRRAGPGYYHCQIRHSRTIAILAGTGLSMQDAVASGLGSICRAAWDNARVKAEVAKAATKVRERNAA